MRLRTELPIYIDPEFDELVELANSQWDTVRIGIHKDRNNIEHLVLGSGYGNTHETLVTYLRYAGYGHGKMRDSELKRWIDFDPYILYRENDIAYFNLEDLSGPRKARYETWKKYFNSNHVELLKDLIRESGLVL